MAQMDSSIFLQQKAPDIAGAFKSGMQLSSLAQEQKLRQQQIDDQQGDREALKTNTVTNPDGTTALNRQSYLSDLAKNAPGVFLQRQQQFLEQDANNYQMQMKKRMDQTDMIARAAGSAKDQNSYNQALGYLKQNGIDTSQFPAQYDPNLVQHYQMMSMSAKDQLTQQMQQTELAFKKQHAQAEMLSARAKAAEAGIPSGGGAAMPGGGLPAPAARTPGAPVGGAASGGDAAPAYTPVGGPKQQAQAMQQTLSLLTSARGDPAVGQAEKDIYAAQKLKSLINMKGDPDKLNPNETQLAASEVAKIATGGVPTSHELQGLTQETIPKALASAAQMFLNRPSAANQGAFLKEYEQYADSLSADAQKVIKDKYGRIIESNKRRLHPADYGALKQNFMGRFSNESSKSVSASHPQDRAAVEWAQQNLDDPRAAKILQLNGIGH